MSITALYVYTTTSFKSDSQIESMNGTSVAAGEVQLPTGIYRLGYDASIEPATGTSTSNYLAVKVDGKGGWPDPPPLALQQNNKTADEVRNFMIGASGPINSV